MLQWTDMPNGDRRAFFNLGDRLGWIEISESESAEAATVRAVATIMLGALDSEHKGMMEVAVQEWIEKIGAEALSRDGL